MLNSKTARNNFFNNKEIVISFNNTNILRMDNFILSPKVENS